MSKLDLGKYAEEIRRTLEAREYVMAYAGSCKACKAPEPPSITTDYTGFQPRVALKCMSCDNKAEGSDLKEAVSNWNGTTVDAGSDTLTYEKLAEMTQLASPSPLLSKFESMMNGVEEVRVTQHTPFPENIVRVENTILIHPAIWKQYIVPYLDLMDAITLSTRGTLWGMRVFLPAPPTTEEDE